MAHNIDTFLVAHPTTPELAGLQETIESCALPSTSGSDSQAGQLQLLATLDDAISEIQSGTIPRLVVVYQGVPDEFPQSQIEEIIGLLPLARFIVAYSPWCESIGRTEQKWPIAWCVPVRHLETRLQRLQDSWTSNDLVTPPTASRDETFSQTALRANAELEAFDLTAFVSGDDCHFVETVRDQLQAIGIGVANESADVDLVFRTSSQLSPDLEVDLQRLKRESQTARLFFVCDQVTPRQATQLELAGITTISQLRFGEESVAALSPPEREIADL